MVRVYHSWKNFHVKYLLQSGNKLRYSEDLLQLSMNFHSLQSAIIWLLISSFEQISISPTQGCIVLYVKFDWNIIAFYLVILEKKIYESRQCSIASPWKRIFPFTWANNNSLYSRIGWDLLRYDESSLRKQAFCYVWL